MVESFFIRIRSIFSSVPAFLGALVPVFKSCPPCPVCMPKYAAILSLLGLELADYTHYLIPIMLVSMVLTLVFMIRQIIKRKLSFIPFYLALTSCFGLLIVKYIIDNEKIVYVFMISLFTSIVLHQMNLRKFKSCCSNHKH